MSAAPEAVLRVAIDHLLEGVQVIGFDWRYLYLNDTAARQGRRSATELVGRTIMSAYPGIERTDLFTVLERVMRERRSERLLNPFDYPTGERRWFELFIEPVPDGLCVLSLDVTDRRVAEDRLLQAQKMEAVGQLAGGVAHDFNNILTAILGYAELISSQIGPDKPIGQDLREIVAAGERAAALTRQLLAFSRQRATAPQVVSLGALVERLEPMLRRLIPENIRIEKRLDPDTFGVRADPTNVEQVLLNLVINARDAMPTGGVLTLATRNVVGDVPAALQGDLQPGEYAVLTVRDTGVGMTADVRARIFEPFFTTKPSGRGTGLGLAAVRNIIVRLGGGVDVSSGPQQGASFDVFLPASHERQPETEPPAREAAPVGKERVLLVEDEPVVRAFSAAVLRRHGYAVVEAGSAEQALAALAESAGVDLLLTDVVLPAMSGPELAHRLGEEWPQVRVLFMSGHVESGLTALPQGARFLEKPFNARTLLARAREALESPGADAPDR